MSRLAYFDCFSGIAGDMVLGAIVDAGIELGEIEEALRKLPVEPFELDASRVERHSIAATHVRVRSGGTGLVRTFGSIRVLLEEAELPDAAKRISLDAYTRLAEAEAKVHGTDVAHAPLHQLSDIDTIVDITGSAVGLTLLGVERVEASAVATGMGMVRGDHGVHPIPAPAVVELLKGVPLYSRGIPAELTTPTGAAILAATARRYGPLPPMRVEATGYGAGSRELEIPNVLRLLVGEPAADADDAGPAPALVLETNIDDMNPELYEYVIERLLGAGAQDAWITPIVMKRGRPAATLSALCSLDGELAIRDVIFAETTTLGVRRRFVEKWALPRETITVEVAGGEVRVKVARSAGRTTVVAPEYSDCAAVARGSGRPLKEIFAEAEAAARRLLED